MASIINTDVVLAVIKDVEGIFNKHKLNMTDREFVINRLQQAVDAYNDESNNEIMQQIKLLTATKKQLEKDL